MGNFLGVPVTRTRVYWGLYWGSPYFGKLLNLGMHRDMWEEMGLRVLGLWDLMEFGVEGACPDNGESNEQLKKQALE